GGTLVGAGSAGGGAACQSQCGQGGKEKKHAHAVAPATMVLRSCDRGSSDNRRGGTIAPWGQARCPFGHDRPCREGDPPPGGVIRGGGPRRVWLSRWQLADVGQVYRRPRLPPPGHRGRRPIRSDGATRPSSKTGGHSCNVPPPSPYRH